MEERWAAVATVLVGGLLVAMAIFFQFYPGRDSYCTWLIIAGGLMTIGLVVTVLAEKGFWQILGLVVSLVAMGEGIVCKVLGRP